MHCVYRLAYIRLLALPELWGQHGMGTLLLAEWGVWIVQPFGFSANHIKLE